MAFRSNWYKEHPAACTCVRCQRNRSEGRRDTRHYGARQQGSVSPIGGSPTRSPRRPSSGQGWLWVLIILAAIGVGVWLGWDNIAQIISDSQTSTTSSRTRALSIPLTPTEVATASPTPIPTNTLTPRYTTKHGKALPLIDTDVLEGTIVSLVNDVRLMDNLESLVRVSSLDDLATAHSRHMADSQQAKARPLETGCGGSGTHIVQWPQVKSFSYRGPAAAPTTTTPTEYDETVKETAAGVVGYIHEGDVPYTKDPHYRYVGVGVVQSFDELGYGRGYVNRCVNDIRRRPSQPLIQWRFHPHTVHRDRRLRSTQGPSDA